jgi:hypothetical protein
MTVFTVNCEGSVVTVDSGDQNEVPIVQWRETSTLSAMLYFGSGACVAFGASQACEAKPVSRLGVLLVSLAGAALGIAAGKWERH